MPELFHWKDIIQIYIYTQNGKGDSIYTQYVYTNIPRTRTKKQITKNHFPFKTICLLLVFRLSYNNFFPYWYHLCQLTNKSYKSHVFRQFVGIGIKFTHIAEKTTYVAPQKTMCGNFVEHYEMINTKCKQTRFSNENSEMKLNWTTERKRTRKPNIIFMRKIKWRNQMPKWMKFNSNQMFLSFGIQCLSSKRRSDVWGVDHKLYQM